jgi:hypothetical protein
MEFSVRIHMHCTECVEGPSFHTGQSGMDRIMSLHGGLVSRNDGAFGVAFFRSTPRAAGSPE